MKGYTDKSKITGQSPIPELRLEPVPGHRKPIARNSIPTLGKAVDLAELAASYEYAWETWGNNSRMDGRPEFFGTETFRDGLDLMRQGWREGADRLVAGVDAFAQAHPVPDLTPAYNYDVAGEMPDVAAFCAGEPEHMITPEDRGEDRPKSVVRIVLQGGYPHYIKAHQVEAYGVALLSVIDALKESGRSVGIEWSSVNSGDDDLMVIRDIGVARPGDPLDISALAAVLHPTMNRRIRFALDELTPRMEKGFQDGYGIPERTYPPGLRKDGHVYPPGPWAVCEGQGIEKSNRSLNIDQAIRQITDAIQHQGGF